MHKKDWADYGAERILDMVGDGGIGEINNDEKVMEEIASCLRAANRRDRSLISKIQEWVKSFYGSKRDMETFQYE